jgi:GDP/UDP-N,N'-diacetylbacillosamine 2-epimerase (hydrolysing)
LRRKILYVTGTRADFGLLRPTLETLHADSRFDLGIAVTGMHLSERFGATVGEIEQSGLQIVAHIPVDIDEDSGLAMALATSRAIDGLARLFAGEPPDIVLVLGDRLEMLAAAVAAICFECVVVHVHGGERSGTIDESIRHAISKLAHYHLVATEGSRERLLRMGEDDWRIEVVGAPGLVGIERIGLPARSELCARHGLAVDRPFAIMLFHPVVQDADLAGSQSAALLDALEALDLAALCLLPNADAGNSPIRSEIMHRARRNPMLKPITHLERSEYIQLMATCDVLIGNSSSGILEAGSFGTPVVNIGERQRSRERNGNVIDVGHMSEEIAQAIAAALASGRLPSANLFYQPETDARIANLLATVSLDRSVRKKLNSY